MACGGVDLGKTSSKMAHKYQLEYYPSCTIRSANQKLLLRQFETCLEVCQDGIVSAASVKETIPGRPSSDETIEALCVIAIQAYAELNRWPEVLPFITKVYSGMEDCPAKIIQLCILLHSRVKEFGTCVAVAHIWLQNPTNHDNPQYTQVVEIFLRHVLYIQHQWDEVSGFLQRCPGLTESSREQYISHTQKIHEEVELREAQKQEKLQNALAKRNESGETIDKSQNPSGISGLLRNFISLLHKSWASGCLRYIRRLTLFLVIIYLLVTRANFVYLSSRQLTSVGLTLQRLWKAMFAPFHTLRQ